MIAVGLDGMPVIEKPVPIEMSPAIVSYYQFDIAIFDGLLPWARTALREEPKNDIPARLIAPHIYSGAVNRFNISEQIRANDAREMVSRGHS